MKTPAINLKNVRLAYRELAAVVGLYITNMPLTADNYTAFTIIKRMAYIIFVEARLNHNCTIIWASWGIHHYEAI